MTTIFKEVLNDASHRPLINRYHEFIKVLKDDTEPQSVFAPLKQELIEELQLIREISQYLQKKKNDDVNKTATQTEEKTETKEETPEETTEKQES